MDGIRPDFRFQHSKKELAIFSVPLSLLSLEFYRLLKDNKGFWFGLVLNGDSSAMTPTITNKVGVMPNLPNLYQNVTSFLLGCSLLSPLSDGLNTQEHFGK